MGKPKKQQLNARGGRIKDGGVDAGSHKKTKALVESFLQATGTGEMASQVNVAVVRQYSDHNFTREYGDFVRVIRGSGLQIPRAWDGEPFKEAYAEHFVEPVPPGGEVEYPSEVNPPYKMVPVHDYPRWGKCGSVEMVTPMCAPSNVMARKLLFKTAEMGEWKRRVAREVECLRRLKHDHIIILQGVYTWRGETYLLIKPFVEGTLKHALNGNFNNPELDHNVILNWMMCLSGALAYIHHVNITHRDIKPDNILVDPKFSTSSDVALKI
jgi:serine/threonine protein kinase